MVRDTGLGNPMLLTGVVGENRENLEAETGTGLIGIGAGLVGIRVGGVGIRDGLIGDEAGAAGTVTGLETWPSDRHRLELKVMRRQSQWMYGSWRLSQGIPRTKLWFPSLVTLGQRFSE
jgi:hypothetical protein